MSRPATNFDKITKVASICETGLHKYDLDQNDVTEHQRCSAWLGTPRAGPALWNYPAPPYSRRINTIHQKDSAWCVLPTFEYLNIQK